jgi:hypothetical protein
VDNSSNYTFERSYLADQGDAEDEPEDGSVPKLSAMVSRVEQEHDEVSTIVRTGESRSVWEHVDGLHTRLPDVECATLDALLEVSLPHIEALLARAAAGEHISDDEDGSAGRTPAPGKEEHG